MVLVMWWRRCCDVFDLVMVGFVGFVGCCGCLGVFVGVELLLGDL